jgi:hypothetical protein
VYVSGVDVIGKIDTYRDSTGSRDELVLDFGHCSVDAIRTSGMQ